MENKMLFNLPLLTYFLIISIPAITGKTEINFTVRMGPNSLCLVALLSLTTKAVEGFAQRTQRTFWMASRIFYIFAF